LSAIAPHFTAHDYTFVLFSVTLGS